MLRLVLRTDQHKMGLTQGVIFLTIIGVTYGTSCSETNRGTNLDQCLTDIVVAGLDNNAYWFGTQYATDCPLGPTTIECINPRPQPSYGSIFTRILSGYDSTLLDRYLKMVFTTAPGSYSGCGNTYTINETWTKDIDPLADETVRPWYVRNFPELEWTANQDEMFTLVVYDVSYLYYHGVYINIMGNDITTAEKVKTYHGPQISTSLRNPYAFLLFKQTGMVTVSQEVRQKIEKNDRGDLSVTDLKTSLNLTGPVAINWIVATGDVYAAQRMLDAQILNMCPDFVAQKLNIRSRPFLPIAPVFNVGVNVKFDVTALDFTVCCSTHRYGQATFDLNPLGNPVYDTYKTSHTPTVTLLKKGLYEQATNFTGDLYTLLAVDPDVPIATVGTQQKPLVHWLVANIQDGNINSGTEIHQYRGPQPPDRTTHYYYFLLYKQDYSLSKSSFQPYPGNCAESLIGRCLFDVSTMATNINLTLVGASWMTATTDIYVAKRKIETGEDINQWCTGMPGYKGDPNCPVGISTRVLGSSVLVLFAIVLLKVF